MQVGGPGRLRCTVKVRVPRHKEYVLCPLPLYYYRRLVLLYCYYYFKSNPYYYCTYLVQYHNYFYYCLTLLAPTSLSQWGRKLLHPCRITSEEIRKPPTRAPKPTNPGEEMPTETTETPTRGHKRSIPAGTTLTENMDKRGDPNGPSPEEKSLLN